MAPHAPGRRLACVVIAGYLLAAASGLRRHEDHRARSAAERFALNRSRVEGLCTEEVASGACEALGAGPDQHAEVTAAELRYILAASADEVVALLESVGLGAGAPFSCLAFCEAAVSSIPKILCTAAPAKAGLGCIDAACEEGEIDVSADVLAQEGLGNVPHAEAPDVLELPPGGNTSHDERSPEKQAGFLFRMALNVILGIFPAVDEVDGETLEPSLLQHTSPGNERGDRPFVVFGQTVHPSRHWYYHEFVMKASAWIAIALRRLRAGRFFIKKWFILTTTSQADDQEEEARDHLKRMLALMSNIAVHTGDPVHACKVDAHGGVVAYVSATRGCNVQSRQDCGLKDQDDRYVVSICEFFWRPSNSDASRVATFVHESSHHFGTVDTGYCTIVDCLALSSWQARNNADSYKMLVQDLVLAESQVSQGIPDKKCNLGCDATKFGSYWKGFDRRLPENRCGICEERNRILGCKVWELTMASRFLTSLCCQPITCATATTTTTTTELLCPRISLNLRPDRWGDCHCFFGFVCSQSGQFADCPRANQYAGSQAFHASCSSCNCYPGGGPPVPGPSAVWRPF